MRRKHWCAWSSFQSCIPGFKGHPLVLRLRVGSQLPWSFPSEGFSYEADCLSALLSRHVRSLTFTPTRVAFFLCSQLSCLYLCSLQCGRSRNASSQQDLIKLCWETWLALLCWRVGAAAVSHHSLHLHLAHTTLSPRKHFNSKGYL